MRALTLWFAAGAVVAPAVMPAQTRSRTEMVRAVDSLVIKGYGSADRDLEVPTPANAGYEIGSVTKQFTTGGGCGPPVCGLYR